MHLLSLSSSAEAVAPGTPTLALLGMASATLVQPLSIIEREILHMHAQSDALHTCKHIQLLHTCTFSTGDSRVCALEAVARGLLHSTKPTHWHLVGAAVLRYGLTLT